MNQPANAAREKRNVKGKGRGRSPGAKTVNRTHGAARPGGHHNPYPLFRIFKKVVYSDICCSDKKMLQATLGTATRSMNQPANAAREKRKVKGKGRGRSPGAKTVNRTHGAARPGGHHNPYPLFCIFKKVVHSDICCSDEKMLQATLGPASSTPGENATAPLPPATKDSLPHVALPHSYKPIKIVVGSMDCDHTALACTELLESARRGASNVPGGVVVFDMDAEWSVWAIGVRPVAVVQLSTIEGYTVVFHIKPNERRAGVFPKAFGERGYPPGERERISVVLFGGRPALVRRQVSSSFVLVW